MSITTINTVQSGLVGVLPSVAYINTTDTLATVMTAGYLNAEVAQGNAIFSLPCMALVSTQTAPNTAPQLVQLQVQHLAGNWSLIAPLGAGSEIFTDTTASATPGTIRALVGNVISTATTVTSGNLVGARGAINMVGASGGFFYGLQGKIISTGTLSGSSWTAGVFAQLDISAATMNAGQIAPVWADYGTSSGTITSATGMRMFAGTNTTAATLNSMIYLYGKASNLFELSLNGSTYVSTGGAGTLSGTIEKIAITIGGVQYYIPCATVIS